MFGKTLLILSALSLAAVPGAVGAQGLEGGSKDGIKRDIVMRPGDETGGQSYGDRNHGGPYGFYSYPRHRHIDDGATNHGLTAPAGSASSPYYDSYYGSAYYGRDYGAPYHGGGYYDRGIYYRERRD